jgi:hypothetical protein
MKKPPSKSNPSPGKEHKKINLEVCAEKGVTLG